MLTTEESLLHSSSVSLHFLGVGHNLSEEFPTECTKFQFLREREGSFKQGKRTQKKKKKITKNSHKSCFWHFRKTAEKIHNKEYIYISTHKLYISIYTAEPQERLRRAWRQGQMP